MQIPMNLSALTALRQPTRMTGGQDGQKLVFIYPILMPSSLGKFTEFVRNLVSVDFVNQIKVSNGLNITSSLSKVGTIGIGDRSINPAVEVRKSLSNSLIPSITNNNNIYGNYNFKDEYDLQKRQQKIEQFNKFFTQQIHNNPRYRVYNPVASTIVADETLLTFPLIVGTKVLNIDKKFLFYILCAAIILDIPLTSEGNLNRLLTYLDNIGLNKLVNIFNKDRSEEYQNRLAKTSNPLQTIGLYRQHKSDNSLNNMAFKLTGSDLARLSAEIKKVFKFDLWNAEVDHIMSNTSNISADGLPIIQTATQRKHFEAAMNSFDAYVSEVIVPILYGMEVILGPTPASINYQNAVQTYLNSITKDMDKNYLETAEHIRIKLSDMPNEATLNAAGIFNFAPKLKDKFDNVQYKLDNLKSFCKSNIELIDTVKKTLYEDLIPHLKNLSDGNPDTISKFCDAIVQTSSRLKPLANTIENWALASIPDQADTLLNQTNGVGNLQHKLDEIKQKFYDETRNFFESRDEYTLYDPNYNINYFHHRYANFSQIFCDCDPNNVTVDENRDCAAVLKQTMIVIEQSIADILYFFYIWNFMSYLCSYVEEVDIDIQIQKKDVLDFPNYTLVLPVEFFKFLYLIYTSNRVKRYLNDNTFSRTDDPQLATSISNTINTFLPNASIPKMIEILNDRLKIPNVIAIDSFKGDVYYQFMYMNKPMKNKIGSLESYINQQKEFITNN